MKDLERAIVFLHFLPIIYTKLRKILSMELYRWIICRVLTNPSMRCACEVGRKLNAIVTLEVIGGSWDQRVCGRQFFYTEIAIIFAFVLVLDIICPKNSILKRSLTLVYFPMARLETPPIIKLRKFWSTIYFTDLLSSYIIVLGTDKVVGRTTKIMTSKLALPNLSSFKRCSTHIQHNSILLKKR